jgi:cytochrome c-type biogenesis protein CcmE
MSKGIQLAIGATLIFSLLGWYGYSNVDGATTFQYYQTLDEFLINLDGAPGDASGATPGSSVAGKSLRVHGYVAPGSIDRNLQAKHVMFKVQNDPPHKSGAGASTLSVRFQGLETPDLFQDGADVVVEGTLTINTDGAPPVFLADNVLAKCPSKFEANTEVPEGDPTNL